MLQQVSTSTVYKVWPDSDSLSGHYLLEYCQDNRQVYTYYVKHTTSFYARNIPYKSLLMISNVTNFSIVGSGSDDTVLTCIDDTAGVVFAYSNGIGKEKIANTNCSQGFQTQHSTWIPFQMYFDSKDTNLMISNCKNIIVEDSLLFSPSRIGLSICDRIMENQPFRCA